MFEFHQYDPRWHAAEATPKFGPCNVSTDISEISLLYWSEHCIECAAPACFSTCDLYEPRPDSRCRRFSFGMYKNTNFHSFRGYGIEVEFKKWGKLETRSNLKMEPVRSLLRKERLTEFCLPLANLLGSTLGRITRDKRWEYLSYAILSRVALWLHRRKGKDVQPDAFLLEVYNPISVPVKLQLRMTPRRISEKEGTAELIRPSKFFAATITLEPGYSKHRFDRHLFQPLIDSEALFDISLLPEGDNSLKIIVLTADFVRFEKVAAASAAAKLADVKCIVWDLDNTLWDGVLLEESNVQLRHNSLELIKRLDGQGILMSIASKNDYPSAWEKLKEIGVADFFLYPQINWLPKSEGIKQIAKKLNIGLDTFAFIDDNPFELAEVSQSLPMVTCIPVDRLDSVLSDSRFKGSDSTDARNRRFYYKAAILREETQAQYGDDYVSFLAHTDIQLTIKKYEASDFDRVSELVQRTNQLNFSGRKYKKEDVAELVGDCSTEKYVLACSDKFGTYGTVGFSIVNRFPDEIVIDDLMLSCRVQGKFIEKALFSYLLKNHNPHGSSRLRINYRETNRNTPAKQVLDQLGFKSAGKAGGCVFDGALDSLECDFIRVESLTSTSPERMDPSHTHKA